MAIQALRTAAGVAGGWGTEPSGCADVLAKPQWRRGIDRGPTPVVKPCEIMAFFLSVVSPMVGAPPLRAGRLADSALDDRPCTSA